MDKKELKDPLIYSKPFFDIVKFDFDDVIRTSGVCSGDCAGGNVICALKNTLT